MLYYHHTDWHFQFLIRRSGSGYLVPKTAYSTLVVVVVVVVLPPEGWGEWGGGGYCISVSLTSMFHFNFFWTYAAVACVITGIILTSLVALPLRKF